MINANLINMVRLANAQRGAEYVFDFATNMIAYWPLATNSLDSSGNAHNGTDTGMTYSGGYAEFGSGKYVDVADSNDFSFTDGANDLSAHFLLGFIWNDKTGIQIFINKRGQLDNREWEISSNGTIVTIFFFNPDGTNWIRLDIPVTSITASVLNTLQFAYTGSETHGGLSAFLNGNNPLGTTSLAGTYTGQVNGNSIIRMGARAFSTANPLLADGKEWAIWKDRTMTGSEIQELHDRVIAGTPII